MLRPCEPNILAVPAGFLATTPPDYPYQFAVPGGDEEQARRRFAAAFAAWEELHDRADDLRRTGTVGS